MIHWPGFARCAVALMRAIAVGNRVGADPVDLGGVEQRRADGVHVRIDQARNDGAAARDRSVRVPLPASAADVGRRADRHDLAVAHRERLGRGRGGVERDDLAVEQDGVGVLAEGGRPRPDV